MLHPKTVAAIVSALTTLALPATVLAPLAQAGPLLPGETQLIGAAASGSSVPLPVPVDDSSLGASSVSLDGRYVTFSSSADGLSTQDDDLGQSVFVKDRQTGIIELVSRRTGVSGAPSVGTCFSSSISDDGQRVAFSCSQPLDAADANGHTDVYVRDRVSQTTTLVSRTFTAVGDGESLDPMISGNGLFVAFKSFSGNLIGGVPGGQYRIYRRLLSGTTLDLIDRPTSGLADASASKPSISDDGSRIAFESTATNLVSAGMDTNATTDVFLRNVTTGQTLLMSCVDATCTGQSTGTAGGGSATLPAISGDGTAVAYQSAANNVVASDTESSYDIYVRTVASAVVHLASRANGLAGANSTGNEFSPAISTTGDAVTFVGSSSGLDPSVTAPAGSANAYVRRMGAGTTELISRRSGGGAPAAFANHVNEAGISGNASVVVVEASGLSADADAFQTSVFARDLATPVKPTTLVSRPAGSEPFVNTGGDAYLSGPGAVGADGRFVVFTSYASGLPGQPATEHSAIWRRDVVTGEVVLVSRADGLSGAAADDSSLNAAISADGNRVAFMSTATNLFPGALPSTGAIYVRDIAAGTTVLASRADGPSGAYVNAYGQTAISADGTKVGFVSASPAVGVNDFDPRLFVRDLAAASTTRVAPAQTGSVTEMRFSADGRQVVWQRELHGKSPGEMYRHVWTAAVPGGTAIQVDAGVAESDSGFAPTISADGTKVAFVSAAALTPADTNGTYDAYVSDRSTGAMDVASLGAGGVLGDSGAQSPELSADGRVLAFLSGSTNLVPGATSPYLKAFVRNLSTGAVTLVSPAATLGATQPDSVNSVSLSADGSCVAFATRSAGLLPGLSPDNARVWMRAVGAPCPKPAAVAPPAGEVVGASKSPGSTPVVPSADPALAPRLSGLSAKPAKFKTTGKRAGTLLSFTLNSPAKLTLVLSRSTAGHRVKTVCKGGTAKKGQKRCVRLKTVLTINQAGTAGKNTLKLTGKVKRRRLAKGAYVATLTAVSAAGTSVPVSIKLRVR